MGACLIQSLVTMWSMDQYNDSELEYYCTGLLTALLQVTMVWSSAQDDYRKADFIGSGCTHHEPHLKEQSMPLLSHSLSLYSQSMSLCSQPMPLCSQAYATILTDMTDDVSTRSATSISGVSSSTGSGSGTTATGFTWLLRSEARKKLGGSWWNTRCRLGAQMAQIGRDVLSLFSPKQHYWISYDLDIFIYAAHDMSPRMHSMTHHTSRHTYRQTLSFIQWLPVISTILTSGKEGTLIRFLKYCRFVLL